jgi:hypothetical protein
MNYQPSTFLFLFLTLTSFYVITVGIERYCCIWWHSRTHTNAVRFLWMRDGLVPDSSTRTINKQTQETNIHAASGIRSRNPSKREASDSRMFCFVCWRFNRLWFLVGNQLEAQFILIICLFESSTCFEQLCAHPQEDNCIATNSGITHSDYTRSCINTIVLLRISTVLLETCRGFK